MVKLKEIPRTATFAWSPTVPDLYLATGTVAGAIDADFSSTSKLDIWNLDLIDHSSESFVPKPVVSVDTDARYVLGET
jgi:protein transport protein SEC31